MIFRLCAGDPAWSNGYGLWLFVLGPILGGYVASIIACQAAPERPGLMQGSALLAALLACSACMLYGIEGIICAMCMLFFPIGMMMTVIMGVMFTMFVLVAMMSITMMHMVRR